LSFAVVKTFDTVASGAARSKPWNAPGITNNSVGTVASISRRAYRFDHTGFLTIDNPLHYGKNHVDWLAGTQYNLTPDKMVYATVSTGFRSDGAQPRPFVPAQLQSYPSEKIKAYEAISSNTTCEPTSRHS